MPTTSTQTQAHHPRSSGDSKPKYPWAEPCWHTKEVIEGYGQETASLVDWKVHRNSTIDLNLLNAIVSRFGGKIAINDSSSERHPPSQAILVDGFKKFTIWLDTGNNVTNQNMLATVIHELSHYILHYLTLREKDKIANGQYNDKLTMSAPFSMNTPNGDYMRTEWEALWFVFGFLLPKNEFIEVYHETKDVGIIAERLNAPSYLVQYRIHDLELED